MQTVSLGESLHEMSNPIFWNKSEQEHRKWGNICLFTINHMDNI